MKYNELKVHGEPDFPIELYHLDHTSPKYEMACHYHNDLEIIHILKGCLSITLNNSTFTASAGDFVFVNSETLHSATPENCEYECIVFNFDFFLSIPERGALDLADRIKSHDISVQPLFNSSQPEIYNNLHNIFSAMNEKSDGYRFLVISEIYRLFSLILKHKYYIEALSVSDVADDKSSVKLKKVLSFIRENYTKPLTLEEMSSVAGMSEKYFCYFFKKMTNKTPVEYLISYRIECSARQLLNTDMSVTETAYSSGFNDLSYFIKTFKSLKGVTPKEFRKGILV